MFASRSRLGALISHQENRHATAGCLLSLLLFLPLLSRFYNPLVLGCIGLIYAGFIVPLLLSYISVSVCVKGAGWIASFFSYAIKQISAHIWCFLTTVFNCAFLFHEIYVHLDTANLLANQVVFFTLVEKIICPEQHFSCLHSLLFFNILAYLKRSLLDRPWNRCLNLTDSEYFLQSTVTFTVLKLAKSVVLTMVLMLFTSRLPDYQVNLNYLLITGVYFVLTTPSFENQFIKMLKRCELDLIEGMEELWCPLVTKLLSLSYSTVFMIMAFPRQSSLIIIACYTNIFIDYVKFRDCLLPQLWRERAILKKYCLVCKSQFIQKGIDPICAVCLDAMSFARLTPCKHSFHGHCLRRWLKENSCCPLCKQTLVRG